MEQNQSLRPSEQARRKRHKHKRSEITAIGAVVLGLAALGLFIIIGFVSGTTINYIKDFIGPDETPAFFENYIAPIVMQDPPAFSNLKKADPILLLKTAIWATISEDTNQGKYQATDDGREIVPISDISIDYVKFFGDDIKPKYQTFTDNGSNYEYDAVAKCYYIPMIAVDNFFTPVVKTITPKNGIVKLSVGYVPGSGWGQNADGTASAPAPTKTMIYTLKGARGKYVITAIEDAPSPDENATQAVSSSQVISSSQPVSSSSKVSSSGKTTSSSKTSSKTSSKKAK